MTAGPPDPAGCDMVCNASPMGMADGGQMVEAVQTLTAEFLLGALPT